MSADTVPLTGYVRFTEAEMAARLEDFRMHMSKRRTIRDFADTPVPQALIETAINTAGTAPSGANFQPWHFVAISDPETKKAIREAAEDEERAFYNGRASDEWLDALAPLGTDDQKPFLETAPWLIAVFAQKRGEHGKNYYVTESVGLATGMLITALHSVGLGTLTHTPAPMTFLRNICERPETEKPFVLLVVGYPADGCTVPAHALEKKSLDEIATFKT
ncbi:oxidoreductase [Algimonas arctica]|uniref:Oxidoreductase n=2 Tax=Algimonas arctica TaxID=1479486 RepID=A0A8J3G0Y1_9PROT|nr:nitroreductase family protein [Algimonas arctica]GHA82569.1 oxidoreductase [Algimonas arctica]